MGESILQEAQKLVYGDRAKDYGDVGECFRLAGRIAKEITPSDAPVAEAGIYFMIALKFARHKHLPKRDNLVDVAGYTDRLAEEQDL